MHRFLIVPVLALSAAVVLGGCSSGANSGHYGAGGGGSTTVGFQGNIYTGSYFGSTNTDPGAISNTTLTVDVNGIITGSMIDASGATTLLGGSITKTGFADVFYQLPDKSIDEAKGTAVIDTLKHVVLTLTSLSGINSVMTVNAAANDLEFAGAYSGSYTQSSGGGSGTVAIVIAKTGAISGTFLPAGGAAGSAVIGSVTNTGVVNLSVTPSGGALDASVGSMALKTSTNATTGVVTNTALIVTTSKTTGVNTLNLTGP